MQWYRHILLPDAPSVSERSRDWTYAKLNPADWLGMKSLSLKDSQALVWLGWAYRDKLKKSGTLTPFWFWPKTQETIASQQWILDLISHDNVGGGGHVQGQEAVKTNQGEKERETESEAETERLHPPEEHTDE